MPELPEVETTKRGVEPHIIKQVIQAVIVRQPKLRWPVPESIQTFVGEQVSSVSRRGKYLIITTGRGDLLMHLGMSGSLRICQADEPALAHDHVDVCFENGVALRLRDPRRFGAVLWADKALEHSLISHLGPEPLTNEFQGATLFKGSRGRTKGVKKYIMDSKIVVGVGNIYANEALFLAGIKPTAAAGKISAARYDKLAQTIKQVLAQAIEAGGTTLKDFVNGEGKPGYFANELNVYGREGLPCLKCDAPLKSLRIDNRATVFCGACQR